MPRRALLAAWLLALAGCTTLLTGGGYDECDKDGDCGAGSVCAEKKYCLKMPDGCRAPADVPPTGAPIPIAALLPLTTGGSLDGGSDESEAQGLNAINLALSELNERRVADRPFALYVCNTAGDKQRVRDDAKWFGDELHVPAIFTSGSSQTLSASNETVSRDMLIMTATATSPELTSLTDVHGGSVGLVWRTAPSDAIQGRVISQLLRTDPAFTGVNKVGVVYVNDPYGQGLNEVFTARFRDATHDVKSIPFERGGDVTAAVNQLTGYGPQVTVLILFPEDVAPLVDAARVKANLSKASGHRWFFTDSAKDPSMLTATVGPEVDNAYGTAPSQGDPASSTFNSFRDRFNAKYSVDPTSYAFTSHSYDAMYLIALASAWAVGPDGNGAVTGPKLAEGLTKVSLGDAFKLQPDQFTPAKAKLQQQTGINIEGASGALDFDAAAGEAPSPIELWQVTGTTFKTLRLITPPN